MTSGSTQSISVAIGKIHSCKEETQYCIPLWVEGTEDPHFFGLSFYLNADSGIVIQASDYWDYVRNYSKYQVVTSELQLDLCDRLLAYLNSELKSAAYKYQLLTQRVGYVQDVKNNRY